MKYLFCFLLLLTACEVDQTKASSGSQFENYLVVQSMGDIVCWKVSSKKGALNGQRYMIDDTYITWENSCGTVYIFSSGLRLVDMDEKDNWECAAKSLGVDLSKCIAPEVENVH